MRTPIKIDNSVKTVVFDIEGQLGEVPRATSLMPEEIQELTTEEALTAFFKKHVGEELWSKLNVGARKQISDGWAAESTVQGKVEPGKSSASPES